MTYKNLNPKGTQAIQSFDIPLDNQGTLDMVSPFQNNNTSTNGQAVTLSSDLVNISLGFR